MHRRRATLVARTCALALVLTIGVAATKARASDTEACVAASEKAQELRNAGKLSEAREQLVVCGRSVCPKLVRQDCAEWMNELIESLPTIVPGAKDAAGRDLVDVTVAIDGKVVTQTLDGKPIEIDPGVHRIRFETKRAPAIEERLVVRQGEKNRIVTVKFAPETSDAKRTPPAQTTPPSADQGDAAKKPPAGTPVAPFLVGGIGLVAIGAAVYLAVDANADAKQLRDECAPNCAQSQVDDVSRRRVIAGITGAAGGAFLIAGVVMFIFRGGGRTKGRATSLPALSVAPLTGGASASATVRF